MHFEMEAPLQLALFHKKSYDNNKLEKVVFLVKTVLAEPFLEGTDFVIFHKMPINWIANPSLSKSLFENFCNET